MADTAAADGREKPSDPRRLTLEAWSQGFMVGALIIMCGITVANMRRGVLLHKLILIELILAIPNGFFMFFDPPAWGWFLSSTAILLITSWTLHNVIAWMKSKPFLGPRGNLIYIGSVLLVQPYWILEIYANFAFFNGLDGQLFMRTRPYEAVFRYAKLLNSNGDPWWIFTILNLFWNIHFRYELGFLEIVQVSPRFGILLLCMSLSMISIIVDILSVTPVIPIGVINPFWKFAFVFKCFTDSIILDDFRSALDKLSRRRMAHILPFSILGDSVPEQSFVSRSPTEGNRQGDQGGSLDAQSNTEISMVALGEGCVGLSDGRGLCPPSPVRVYHVERKSTQSVR